MKLHRRDFLKSAGLAGCAVSLPYLARAGAGSDARSVDLERIQNAATLRPEYLRDPIRTVPMTSPIPFASDD